MFKLLCYIFKIGLHASKVSHFNVSPREKSDVIRARLGKKKTGLDSTLMMKYPSCVMCA